MKSVRVLEIFVASPSDLGEERSLLQGVVEELNSAWANQQVQLDLIMWETHTHPGFGADPQDVINTQIGTSYDIFIGLMWHRFGSPSSRSESGTEEEFERAFLRFKKQGDECLKIMFYFKDAPVSPSEIDADQLAKVKAFKARMSKEKGGLYREFKSADDFRKMIRIHLGQLVPEIIKASSADSDIRQHALPPSPSKESQTLQNLAATEFDEEEGIIELQERATQFLQNAVGIINHINGTIEELGKRIGKHAEEFKTLKAKNLLPDNSAAKRISNAAAEDTELYVQRMSVDVPALQNEYSAAMEAFGTLAIMSGTDLNEPAEDILATLDAFRISRGTMNSTRESIGAFRDAMAKSPRLTTAYNRARKRATAITDDFIVFLKTADSQAAEVERLIEKILLDRNSHSPSLPVSTATGGPMPEIDLDNSAALQEMDDLEYVARMMK